MRARRARHTLTIRESEQVLAPGVTITASEGFYYLRSQNGHSLYGSVTDNFGRVHQTYLISCAAFNALRVSGKIEFINALPHGRGGIWEVK